MDDLFDTSKLHFAAWLQVHDIDKAWEFFSPRMGRRGGTPLYFAAFCGFYDLAERLIAKHPEQVNEVGGHIVAPLPAALSRGHFHVADLLHRHGAAVDVRGEDDGPPLHTASLTGCIDVMRWPLNHGADPNTWEDRRWTSLHLASLHVQLEAIQVLLDHGADIDPLDESGQTPLHVILAKHHVSESQATDVVQRLLEHGSDPNTRDLRLSTPLHVASSLGWLEVARVLLGNGANVDEKDEEGRTPFQVALLERHVEMRKLLSDHSGTQL